MKTFTKNVFSSCIGSLLALAIICLVVYSVVKMYTGKNSVNQTGVLHIPVSGNIKDFSTSNLDLTTLSFSQSSVSLWSLRNKIKAASIDDKISAIFLDIKSAQISQETASEIAEYLSDFRTSGKKIYAYSYYYDQNPYFLSTFADSVFLNPNGGVDIRGYALYSPFFKTLLEKYDIDVNIYYAGKYKSSTEPYRFNSFTKENKFQYRKYFEELKTILLRTISKNRDVSVEFLQKTIKNNNGYDSRFMLNNGLVDGLLYDDEFKATLKRDFDKSQLVPFSSYEIPPIVSKNASTAVVFAEGEITWGEKGSGITHSSISKAFKSIKENAEIKNVVLRINSPGGSGYTSDLIHREIEVLKLSGRKVYASLGPYATSGGYFIAAACDSIFASENTMTGSIGVYIMLPNVNKFLKKHADISVDSIATDAEAIGYTPLLAVSDKQNQAFMDNTEQLYELFLSRVAEGRKMHRDSVDAIAQGRIWSGNEAVRIGLVDQIKSLGVLVSEIQNGATALKVYPEQNQSLQEELLNVGKNNFQVSSSIELKMLKSKVVELEQIMDKPIPTMRIPPSTFVINK